MPFDKPRPNGIFFGARLNPHSRPSSLTPEGAVEPTVSPDAVLIPNAEQTPSPPEPTSRRAHIVCLSDLERPPLEWLWQDRLACGTLAMLSGDPGAGKTWVALAIAAALSQGRPPCGGPARPPCTVLYASAENAASEVVRLRFGKLGGDPHRLMLLRGALDAENFHSLSLRDIPVFQDALQRTHAHLLIIDASPSCLESRDIRAVLDGLAHLAESHRCCVLLVRPLRNHAGGRALYRGLGSQELSGALSTELLVGSSPDAPSHPALVQVKSNLGPLAPALAYKIDAAGRFLWSGASTLTPEDILAERPTGAGQHKRRQAAEWLRENLRHSGRSQGEIETAAQGDGFSLPTLRRAKYDLGIKSTKEGVSGRWIWSLPAAPQQQNLDQQDAQTPT